MEPHGIVSTVREKLRRQPYQLDVVDDTGRKDSFILCEPQTVLMLPLNTALRRPAVYKHFFLSLDSLATCRRHVRSEVVR